MIGRLHLGLSTCSQEVRLVLAQSPRSCERRPAPGRLARVEAGEAEDVLLRGYESACRPAAQANADESFENMKRLGEIARVLGAWPDLASLEARIAGLTGAERQQLAEAIDAQASHFLSDGRLPRPD